MNIFWGHKDFLDIIWGSSTNWTGFRGHFYAFLGYFLIVNVQNGDVFLFFFGGGGC